MRPARFYSYHCFKGMRQFLSAIADVGPGAAEPRKSSIDLYSDSVFRFLARIYIPTWLIARGIKP